MTAVTDHPAQARADRWQRRLTPLVLIAAAAVLPLAIGMVIHMLTDDAPLDTTRDTLTLLGLGLLITFCVAHLHRRATRRRQ